MGPHPLENSGDARNGFLSAGGCRMTRLITAAVTVDLDGGYVQETLQLDEPGAGEVLVEIQASGICHTDLLAPRIMPLPAVLGHEGAGIVRALGPGVTGLAVGDHVVGSYGSCGGCARCRAGEPFHCREFSSLQLGARRQSVPPLQRLDGTPVHGAFFEQSSFASMALMTARNAIRVPAELPMEQLAPLGCGVLTGYGAVTEVLRAQPGQSLVVFGAGGVGLAAIMAARLAGCDPIIAVDRLPGRLALALELGASHAVDAAGGEVLARLKALCGDGADLSVETVGQAETLNCAVEILRPGGSCGVVAVPNLGGPFELQNGRALLTRNVLGIIEGRSPPAAMIPRLAALIAAGRLPMDRYVSCFAFDDLAVALQAVRDGSVAKAVLRM